jgi:hypothetical protein
VVLPLLTLLTALLDLVLPLDTEELAATVKLIRMDMILMVFQAHTDPQEKRSRAMIHLISQNLVV